MDFRTNQGCPGGHITIMSSPSGPTALKIPTSFVKKVLTSFTSLESPTLSIAISPLLLCTQNGEALSTPNSRQSAYATKCQIFEWFSREDIFRIAHEHAFSAEIVPGKPEFFLRAFR